MDDVLGISEMLDHQPKNDIGRDHETKHSDDAYQSAYEAGLASGREAGYRQGYRVGFLDGYKLENPARTTAATPDKTTVESNKAVAKTVTRLRGLPCARCGRTTYSDELECPSCGTPKAHPIRESLAKGRSPAESAAQ
jgi:ribosomal protein L37E